MQKDLQNHYACVFDHLQVHLLRALGLLPVLTREVVEVEGDYRLSGTVNYTSVTSVRLVVTEHKHKEDCLFSFIQIMVVRRVQSCGRLTSRVQHSIFSGQHQYQRAAEQVIKQAWAKAYAVLQRLVCTRVSFDKQFLDRRAV